LESADAIHFFLFQDCLLRIPDEALAPKFGSILLARNLPFRDGDAVLDLGSGAGLIGILAARRGHRVVATDITAECAECTRGNALLNGIRDRLEARTGDLFGPVDGEGFDLIATNPPQMPTPADRDWKDAQSRVDNGGPDGWVVLDRIIQQAPAHLKPRGRLVFTLFEFLGVRRAIATLQAAGLEPRVLAREEQPFPRIARERLEYIRSLDVEGILPPGRPATCIRLVLCGQKIG
jgi:release factor glutamine methyltransferase